MHCRYYICEQHKNVVCSEQTTLKAIFFNFKRAIPRTFSDCQKIPWTDPNKGINLDETCCDNLWKLRKLFFRIYYWSFTILTTFLTNYCISIKSTIFCITNFFRNIHESFKSIRIHNCDNKHLNKSRWNVKNRIHITHKNYWMLFSSTCLQIKQ